MKSQQEIQKRIMNYKQNMNLGNPMTTVYINIALQTLNVTWTPIQVELLAKEIKTGKDRTWKTCIEWKELNWLREDK